MCIRDRFTPATSLIAIATCVVAAIIGMMLIFWLKNQHGKFSFLAKSMLALMVAFTAIGVHLTYSSAVATGSTAENANIAPVSYTHLTPAAMSV